jgi:hypothetical protein
MDVKQARVLVSVSDGRMEFEGSEEFVERQIAAFGDLIKESLRGAPANTKKFGAQNKTTDAKEAGAPVAGLAGYEHLFAKNAQGKIQILKDLPGSGKAKKMVNAALLLTLANTLDGKAATTFKEIRDVCEVHGALDTSNFSTTLKEEIANFVFEGSGGAQALSFTVPGRKVADALAATLNQ